MKQISNHVVIGLTALFVPGGLPIAFAIWVYRWHARHSDDVEGLAHALQRLGLKRPTAIPGIRVNSI